jgi:uncharacterized membrane protein YhaH (DUF805 family)
VRGNVLGFDPDTNTGAISGHDGNRYDFVRAEWRHAGIPQRGDIVDFQAIERRATEIYLVEPSYVAPNIGDFYFSPRGRVSRSQYWLRFWLPYFVIYFVLQLTIVFSGPTLRIVASLVQSLFSLVVLWPTIAIEVKRIHDRNKAWWWILFLYVPFILFVVLAAIWLGGAVLAAAAAGETDMTLPALGGLGIAAIVLGLAWFGISLWFFVEFGCLRGTVGPNRFGPDPVKR